VFGGFRCGIGWVLFFRLFWFCEQRFQVVELLETKDEIKMVLVLPLILPFVVNFVLYFV